MNQDEVELRAKPICWNHFDFPTHNQSQKDHHAYHYSIAIENPGDNFHVLLYELPIRCYTLESNELFGQLSCCELFFSLYDIVDNDLFLK